MSVADVELPADEYIDVTVMGRAEPEFVLARSGLAVAVSDARARYVQGTITYAEFVSRMDAIYVAAQREGRA